jgi:hypothetical protein
MGSRLVSVIGSSECTEEVGRRLAQAGAGEVCGWKGGILEATGRGAWPATSPQGERLPVRKATTAHETEAMSRETEE